MEPSTKLQHRLALSLLPGIGATLSKNLIAHCGSAEAVFQESKSNLLKIPGIGEMTARQISDKEVMKRAEKEIRFMEKHKIRAYYFLDKNYPHRLKRCADAPLFIFQKGETDLNTARFIAMVGSRNATDYGLQLCENFCAELLAYQPVVVSGLAYGIDIASHKSALKNNIPTIAVLAHGLDRLYPHLHRPQAESMVENGGSLITEFLTGTNPDRENFPMRNRVIAGLVDAVVVVEAGKKGGALITAHIANSYNRDVFAFPGRVNDVMSEGCNMLIKSNQAHLLSAAKDLEYIMNWEKNSQREKPVQKELFENLNSEEERIMAELQEQSRQIHLENLCLKCEMPVNQTLSILMNLELKGLVKSKPGRMYTLA